MSLSDHTALPPTTEMDLGVEIIALRAENAHWREVCKHLALTGEISPADVAALDRYEGPSLPVPS